MVPKDGGNRLHGDLFRGCVNSNFVGTNIDQKLIALGLTGQSAVNQIEDFDGSFGGPIRRDRLWFLIAGRKQLTNLQSAGAFFFDGSPSIERDSITARLTWQVSPKNNSASCGSVSGSPSPPSSSPASLT